MFEHVSRYALLVIVLLATVAVDVQADDRPYVRVSPRDSRYFELSDGRPYIPIGLNMVGVWAKAGEDEALDRMKGWMKFKLYGKDKAGIILHDVIFAPFFAGAAGTGQCWHWQNYVDQNKLWWHFARFAKVVEGLDSAAENLQPMMVANANLRVYVLKGENTTLVWCRDAENSWQQELANGVPPRELKDVTIDMSPAGGLAGATARVYDPWKDVWTDIRPDGDAIALPPFKRSIVVKIVR